MPLSFIYAIGFEIILASFEGVIFKVGCETGMWVVSQTSIYVYYVSVELVYVLLTARSSVAAAAAAPPLLVLQRCHPPGSRLDAPRKKYFSLDYQVNSSWYVFLKWLSPV
jgi:hypothetical protein